MYFFAKALPGIAQHVLYPIRDLQSKKRISKPLLPWQRGLNHMIVLIEEMRGQIQRRKFPAPPKPSVKAPLTSFAVRLREARKAAGITQTTLVETTGFGKRSIARYEAGGAPPSIQGSAAIARILGVSLDRLGGLEQDQDPELLRMLSRLSGLSESDHFVAKRILELLTAQHTKK